MKVVYKIFFFSVFLSAQLWAQTDSKIPQDFCISQQEYKLYSLVNTYRAKLALEAIPLSKSLSYVAKIHAADLSKNYSSDDDCNMHSWSDKGTWKAFCFPADQNRRNDIKDKAKKIANYPGKAWELTYWENADADVGFVLEFWNSIPYTSSMIVNTGKWADKEWKSMGVGIQDGYVLLWLGEKVDLEVSTQICETGEKISNYSIPNELVVPLSEISDTQINKNNMFYIIIGSFNQVSDAKSAVTSYHQMGYPKAVLVENQGRTRIAIDSYKTKEDAEKGLEKYKSKFQGAWILGI